MLQKFRLVILLLFYFQFCFSQSDSSFLLIPDRVFDGETMHEGWQVLVRKNVIEKAGTNINIDALTRIIEMRGCTLLPGLIEGHSHLFLHPYNETPWNDQVLKESRAERVARATVHARNTLLAGFTTVRDLGTEGAGYDDAGLKHAIEKGIIPGPRMLVATRAIVAKGAYGPNQGNADIDLPQGAAEAGNIDEMEKEVRTQISRGADVIKVYADYGGWGINGEAAPTFTIDELKRAVEIASSTGRIVVAHSSTAEGMRRAILAGITTIEHGNDGTPEIFKLMKEKGVALCPTLAAGDAIAQYRGWKKGTPEPAGILAKRKSFSYALQAGVTICMGGDVGVFTHGDNAREMEMMVDYGMQPSNVLCSATSVNADVFKINKIVGRISPGLLADIIIVEGDPSKNIHDIRNVRLVMKNGFIYKNSF